MGYRLAADIVVALHFSFILFVIAGGSLAFEWPRVARFHIPVVLYGALIEFFKWPCILTPLENWLRVQGGAQGYETSFTEHYIFPIVYPTALTYRIQVTLGILVIAINGIAYALLYRKVRARREANRP